MDLERLEKLSLEGDKEASRLLEIARVRRGDSEEITVGYDGKWPNACSGTLTVRVGGKLVYSKQHVCESSGGTGFRGGDYSKSYIEKGDLTWADGEEYSWEIRAKVKEALEEVDVCCGGCL